MKKSALFERLHALTTYTHGEYNGPPGDSVWIEKVCDKLCALILANALSWEHAPAQWYRENAHACAWRAERSSDPLAKAAYKEMVRAWLILAIGVEELVRHPLHETRTEEQVLAA